MLAAPLNHQAYFTGDPGYEVDHLVGLAGGTYAQAQLFRLFLSWNVYYNGSPYHDHRAGKLLALILPRRLRIACLGVLSRAEYYLVQLLGATYTGPEPLQVYMIQEAVLNEQANPDILNYLSTPEQYSALMAYLGFQPPAIGQALDMLNDLFDQAAAPGDLYIQIASANSTPLAIQGLGEYLGYPADLIARLQEVAYKFEMSTA